MGSWSSVDLNGHPAELFDPDQARFAIAYLHGSGSESLLDDPILTPVLNRLGLACVRPDGGPCWWTDKPMAGFAAGWSPERMIVESALPFARQRWSLGERTGALFGFGMGGQGALKIAFKRPALFSVAAGIASEIDYHQLYGQGTPLDEMYDSREQCRQDTALMHIHPSDQPRHIEFCCDPDDRAWFRGNDRLHEKLTALGVQHECDLTTTGGGHGRAYFNLMAGRVLERLAAGLELESRRLL